MGKAMTFAVLTVLVACAPTPPAPLSQSEVQEFVRQYVAAGNTGDASKLMELVDRDPAVSSVGQGEVVRGWEAIRKSVDESIAQSSRLRITVGTVDVIPLGTDSALAVAPMFVTLLQEKRRPDIPGSLTIVVKRTPAGLRLIHEHSSLRVQ